MLKVITVKRFDNFHGSAAEEWSNGYHFTGPAPADAAEWDTFLNAVVDLERNVLTNKSQYVCAYGYDDHTGNATRRLDLLPLNKRGAKGAAAGTDTYAPPEMCLLVKFRVGNTAQGKPRYVMKWYHQPLIGLAGTGQHAFPASIETDLNKLRDGTLPGGRKLASPGGVEAGVAQPNLYTYSRDLKRRGKRPTTG